MELLSTSLMWFLQFFEPHGYCYLWTKDILYVHLISDLGITAAYYSIPIALLYFRKQRPDLPMNILLMMFAAFILLCGTTHIFNTLVVFLGIYRMEGVIKSLTAIVSLSVAIYLWRIMPSLLKLPSLTHLREALLQGIERETYMKSLMQELETSNLRLRNLFHSRQDVVTMQKHLASVAESLQAITESMERNQTAES